MIDVAGGNILYYYHFDGLGSVIALSKVNGALVERYSYDVFGEPNRISDVNNPYMFTGREYDEETGNYYCRARYYNPHIGRFLQADPIGYRAGLNLYTYCRNNPIMFVDPMGLTWGDDVASVASAIVGALSGDGGTIGGGQGFLQGTTTVGAYSAALRELEKDAGFIESPNYDKLREIAQTPLRDTYDPDNKPEGSSRGGSGGSSDTGGSGGSGTGGKGGGMSGNGSGGTGVKGDGMGGVGSDGSDGTGDSGGGDVPGIPPSPGEGPSPNSDPGSGNKDKKGSKT